MKRIVICDDSEYDMKSIKKLIDEYVPENKEKITVSCYSSGEELLADDHEKIDIAILDVEMDRLSGIETGYKILEKYPDAAIIIVTSYPTYLDDAMDLRVFRFFEKPVDKDRLFRALDIRLRDSKPFILETNSEILSLREEEIVYIVSKLRKTEILKSDGGIMDSPLSKKKWVEMLSNNNTFAMPHGSYIVNLNYVRQIKDDYIIIECKTGRKEKIYCSKRFISDFKKAFLKKMEEYK